MGKGFKVPFPNFLTCTAGTCACLPRLCSRVESLIAIVSFKHMGCLSGAQELVGSGHLRRMRGQAYGTRQGTGALVGFRAHSSLYVFQPLYAWHLALVGAKTARRNHSVRTRLDAHLRPEPRPASGRRVMSAVHHSYVVVIVLWESLLC